MKHKLLLKGKLFIVFTAAVFTLGIFSPIAMALSYNDIATEFMCQCGCNEILKECDSMPCSVKDTLKGTISGMIKSGQSRDQIIKVMRINYKDKIMAAPPREGFNWVAYITPFAMVVIGGMGIVWIVNTWVGRREVGVEFAAGNGNGKKTKAQLAADKKYSDKLKEELNDLRWY